MRALHRKIKRDSRAVDDLVCGGTWRFYCEITGWVEKQGLGRERLGAWAPEQRSHTSRLTQWRTAANALPSTQRASRSGPKGGCALVASSHAEAPACGSCFERQHPVPGPPHFGFLPTPPKHGVLSQVSHTLQLPADSCCLRDNGSQIIGQNPFPRAARGSLSPSPETHTGTQECWAQHTASTSPGTVADFRPRPGPRPCGLQR